MSFADDYANCVTKNVSNIPVPKRICTSRRKISKYRVRFPALQKYIQSIINVDSDHDSEDACDKNEITSNVEKSGNNEVGNENKKVAKGKFKLNLNSENTNERIKTAFSVSSRENISSQFYSHFRESRNWDVIKAQNDLHKNLQIANVLKNLFPNPFELTKIPEFNKSKISMYIEKIVRVDVTLPDVIVSESNTPKILHSTRVAKIFEADYDKSSTQMDSWTLNSSTSVKNNRSKTSESRRRTNFSDDLAIYPISSVIENLVNYKRYSATNKNSSCESAREKREKERDSIHGGERGTYEESNFLRGEKTPKSLKNPRQQSLDCDLGKLKLLTVTDSDDSSKNPSKKNGRKLDEDSGSGRNASESSRDNKFQFISNVTSELEMVKEVLNELSQKHEINQTKARNRSKSDGRERKMKKFKSKNRKLVNSLAEGNCPKIVENEFDNNKEPNLKMTKIIKDEEKKKERSKSEENRSTFEDKEMVRASEKIDEVLKFMSDCLMRLGNDNVPVKGDAVKKANGSEKKRGGKCSKLDAARSHKSDRDLPSTTEAVATPQTSFLTSTSWRQSAAVVPHSSEVTSQNIQFDHVEILDPDVVSAVFSDSIAINNDTTIQTVEIQNELGGYAEEQETELPSRDLRLSKSVLPLSVKIKQSKRNTYEVLKNALEREEKRMSEEFNLSKLPSRNDFFENPFETLTTKSRSACSVIGSYRGHNSNFVICLNSLPGKVRGRNPMGFSFCPRLISFCEVQRPVVHSLPYYQDSLAEELKQGKEHVATRYAVQVEVAFVMYRSIASHVSRSIGVSFALESSKVEEEMLLRNSETRIIKKYKPIKKSFYVKPSDPPKAIDYVVESFQRIDFDSSSISNGQIEELEEAVKQTEKVYFLEQSSGAASAGSKISTSTKNQSEEESAKTKIQRLLLRTYSLQQKLQRHLQILTAKPTSISCPSICRQEVPDFGIPYRNSEVIFREGENASDDTKVHWSFKPPKNSNVPSQVSTSEIQKTDQSTSCELLPVEELNEIERQDKDFDDRSSLDSFKSSNDCWEGEKEPTVLRKRGKTKQAQFLRNICNEIELFKNRITSDRDKETEADDWTEASEVANTSTKLLKTVFKGKQSTTELSLGLKSIPLGKLNNISVEKKKISENHTKISICISKEKLKNLTQKRPVSTEVVHNRLSYCLDSARTSLSSSRTDYGAGSEDDEDDFKSVVSNLSRPNSETNFLDEVTQDQTMETVPPKSVAKHRFDFYKKMGSSKKTTHRSMSNTSCSYEEFEPLKQALTEMQVRMRSLKRDGCLVSNDYYQRALKLAKMSAGYCQNCGSRTVIPQDTFGYYNTILPRSRSHRHQSLNLRASPPRSSYYSLRSNVAEFSDQIRDLQHGSSYLVNSSRTVIRNPFNDVSIYSDVL